MTRSAVDRLGAGTIQSLAVDSGDDDGVVADVVAGAIIGVVVVGGGAQHDQDVVHR